MRISIEKDDPGYKAYGKLVGDGTFPKVYLDGVEQNNCLTADSDEGIVKRHVVSDKGNAAHVGGKFLFEIVHGKVEIVIPPTAEDAA